MIHEAIKRACEKARFEATVLDYTESIDAITGLPLVRLRVASRSFGVALTLSHH